MAEIGEMIAALRSLSELAERTAKIGALKLDQAVKATAGAAATPDGKAWAPKKTGGRAMPRAAQHITTQAIGTSIRQTLTGPDVFHHFGKGKSQQARQVIPDGGAGMPKMVADVLEQASVQAFDELMAGK